MAYIGSKPADKVLTASDITDGVITKAKLADTYFEYVNSDITALALREATNEASAAFNLPNQFIDTFATDVLGTKTDVTVSSGYVETTNLSFTATSVNMGSNNSARVNNGAAVTIESDGNIDISSWSINSEGTPTANDTYGVKIDLGSSKTLATPLRWLPNGKRYKSQGGGSDDYNAGITEINFGSSDGSGWQFGSGGVTPTLTNSGDWTEWSTASNIYNQDFTQISEGYYHSSGTSSTGSDYIQYAWTGTVTGRYMYISMNPTNGVFNGFTMTDANGNLFAPTFSATGTAIQAANTVASAKTKVGGTMLYKDNAGTATLGTDLIIYFTCDGGSNWTEADSYNAVTPVYSTGVKQVRLGETTCTSGTDIRYKAVWANQAAGSKETQLHGIGVNY